MNLNQRGLAGYQRGQIRWCAPVEAETSSAQLLVDFVCRTVFSVRTLSTRRFTIPCSLSFKLRRHLFFSFKKSKRKIFHTIIYNMFVRNRRNFWNSRVCVWITFETNEQIASVWNREFCDKKSGSCRKIKNHDKSAPIQISSASRAYPSWR